MNVSLTPELEELVDERVSSGMYHSASEVVREALRLLEERDTVRKLRLAELRQKIARGIEQAEAGLVGPLDIGEIKARARRQLARSSRR